MPVCADCGHRGALLFRYGPGRRGTLITVPKATLRLLRGPLAPICHLAAVIGVVLGLAVDGRLGLAWWQITLVVMGLSWPSGLTRLD